jgi:hypothetical protein
MKYRCYGLVSGSKYLGIVEADSAIEAEEKAANLDSCYVSFCWQCSSNCENPEINEIDVELEDQDE